MADVGSCVSFREVQGEGWSAFRIWALCAATFGWGTLLLQLVRTGHVGSLTLNAPLFLLTAVALPLVAFFGRFVTTVQAGHLDLRRSTLGIALRGRSIPLAAIRSAELGSCYPNIDHGSWATHAGGPSGVRLHLEGGETVQVASERPEELLAALRTPEASPAA